MNVNKLIEELQKVADAGYGFVHVVATDGRSGVTSACHGASLADRAEGDDWCGGILEDLKNGDKYCSLYLDH